MFTLTIKTSNAAFSSDEGYAGPAEELARILELTATRLRKEQTHGMLLDINGNHVGSFELTP